MKMQHYENTASTIGVKNKCNKETQYCVHLVKQRQRIW